MSRTTSGRPQGGGAAFLLAQIGAHAAARFAERLEPIGLTPAHAGILWNLGSQPDMSQRALAEHLGAFPSRLVVLLDELEHEGWIERRARPDDRRSHSLHLTEAGKAKLDELGRIARQHQDDLCAGLSDGERAQLRELLQKIAIEQQLPARAHPGYRKP